jgi:hypothetical protein
MEAKLMTDPERGEGDLRHFCSFHRSGREQRALAVPFLDQGLSRGERCIVFSDEIEKWGGQGRSRTALETGQEDAVSVWSSEAWRPSGPLNSLQMARHVWQLIEEALREHPACRFVVDMRWTGSEAAAAFCHLEATLDLLYTPDVPARVLCQFDHGRLPVAILHAALRTHPAVRAGERLVPNLYYEAPAILENEPHLNECSTDGKLVHGLLSQFVPAL